MFCMYTIGNGELDEWKRARTVYMYVCCFLHVWFQLIFHHCVHVDDVYFPAVQPGHGFASAQPQCFASSSTVLTKKSKQS